MSNVEISIVIPIYNSEKYLSRCIESVINQVFTDFELILVDDGSTDNSSQICAEYIKKDNRIIYRKQTNGGVSSARNTGIEISEGKWIAFIDSDDWIEPDYLQTLLGSAAEDGVDLITSGLVYRFDDGSEQTETPAPIGIFDAANEQDFYSIVTQALITSPVAKLYKLDIIRQARLYFDHKLSYGEDRDFNVRYLEYCRFCRIIGYSGYNYQKNIESSLSTIKPGDNLKGDIDYWNKLHALFTKKRYNGSQVIHYLEHRLFFFIIDYISRTKLSAKQIKDLDKNVNWEFLLHNKSHIKESNFVKYLLLHKQLHVLNRYMQFMRYVWKIH